MKVLLSLCGLLIIAFSVYQCQQGSPKSDPQRVFNNLPWQVETQANGNTRIFGITLGESTLSEIITLLGDEYRLAIIQSQDSIPALEIYYAHFKSGPLKGKLVMAIDAPQEYLQQLLEDSKRMDYMATGSRQYELPKSEINKSLSLSIRAMSFVPGINLDDEIIRQRFGEPKQVIHSDDNSSHYLYPSVGVGVTLHKEGKEVIQYVLPSNFELLTTPLQTVQP